MRTPALFNQDREHPNITFKHRTCLMLSDLVEAPT